MSSRLKNQRGAVDMILIGVVLVAAIAVAGYAVYQQRQVKDINVVDANYKKTFQAPSSWVTETIADEHLSYSHPADWKILDKIEKSTQISLDKTASVLTYNLTSRSGYKLHLSTQVQGLGGGCTPDSCPTVHYYKVTKIADGLKVVQVGIKGNDGAEYKQIGIIGALDTDQASRDSFAKIVTGTEYKGGLFVYFQSHSADKLLTQFSTAQPFMSASVVVTSTKPTADQFFNSADAKLAEQILETVHYTK